MREPRDCDPGEVWCEREEACLPEQQFRREGGVVLHLVNPLHDTDGEIMVAGPTIDNREVER